ncbi:hypothetical protein ml_394 [Mollivirus sibericum]|uniref:hypothetical protein n=1 Tax=Mollivirus sibericum TaxID=1678078 RepID=UPI0006B2D943|nr:hypothetical protein ml_394 [Mollivirus sibericum]ALD62196.1 hypothetical protein ml_394 [Mollivirus sibericum]
MSRKKHCSKSVSSCSSSSSKKSSKKCCKKDNKNKGCKKDKHRQRKDCDKDDKCRVIVVPIDDCKSKGKKKCKKVRCDDDKDACLPDLCLKEFPKCPSIGDDCFSSPSSSDCDESSSSDCSSSSSSSCESDTDCESDNNCAIIVCAEEEKKRRKPKPKKCEEKPLPDRCYILCNQEKPEEKDDREPECDDDAVVYYERPLVEECEPVSCDDIDPCNAEARNGILYTIFVAFDDVMNNFVPEAPLSAAEREALALLADAIANGAYVPDAAGSGGAPDDPSDFPTSLPGASMGMPYQGCTIWLNTYPLQRLNASIVAAQLRDPAVTTEALLPNISNLLDALVDPLAPQLVIGEIRDAANAGLADSPIPQAQLVFFEQLVVAMKITLECYGLTCEDPIQQQLARILRVLRCGLPWESIRSVLSELAMAYFLLDVKLHAPRCPCPFPMPRQTEPRRYCPRPAYGRGAGGNTVFM